MASYTMSRGRWVNHVGLIDARKLLTFEFRADTVDDMDQGHDLTSCIISHLIRLYGDDISIFHADIGLMVVTTPSGLTFDVYTELD